MKSFKNRLIADLTELGTEHWHTDHYNPESNIIQSGDSQITQYLKEHWPFTYLLRSLPREGGYYDGAFCAAVTAQDSAYNHIVKNDIVLMPRTNQHLVELLQKANGLSLNERGYEVGSALCAIENVHERFTKTAIPALEQMQKNLEQLIQNKLWERRKRVISDPDQGWVRPEGYDTLVPTAEELALAEKLVPLVQSLRSRASILANKLVIEDNHVVGTLKKLLPGLEPTNILPFCEPRYYDHEKLIKIILDDANEKAQGRRT